MKKQIELLAPLIQHMDDNEHNYLIVAGKDGTCSRYFRGNAGDVKDMLVGMIAKHPDILEIFRIAVQEAGKELAKKRENRRKK